jgi:hypothetical protein
MNCIGIINNAAHDMREHCGGDWRLECVAVEL